MSSVWALQLFGMFTIGLILGGVTSFALIIRDINRQERKIIGDINRQELKRDAAD